MLEPSSDSSAHLIMNVKNTQFPLRDLPGASSVKKTFVMLVTMLLCCLTVHAQKLTVESLEYVPNDAAAASYETQMQDINGNYAGIVKVHIALDDVQFEGGGVLKQEKRSINEYWVWMAQGSNRLKVLHPNFLPLEVNFRMYEGVNIVKSKLTYKLVITVPVAGAVQQQDDGKCYLPFIVEPQSATVLVDGEQQNVENGEAIALVTKGSHHYEIKLKSKQASLQVKSATSGVQIYVNNQPRGQAPLTLNLFPGSYRLEARLDGYRTHQQDITVADNESREINIPALERLTGTVMVSYRPIGSDVYVDGQKVGTSPGTFRSVGVGSHKVEIRKEGYVSASQTVSVKENATAELSGTLTSVQSQNTANSNTSVSTTTTGTSSGSNRTFTANGVSFTMVYVEGGTFTMGATSEQESDAWDDEKPAHNVTLSSYYIGETEVTQELWQAVMGSLPHDFNFSSSGIKGAQHPVCYVSSKDCHRFIEKLNRLAGLQFHLPTEAQWEYAARGGNKSQGYKYSGSNDVGSVAWYTGNTNNKGSHDVKTKSPNELGIYDMSGNVCEWCSDGYDAYRGNAQTNPANSSGSYRVNRGGCWRFDARNCRSSCRHRNDWQDYNVAIGLRLAL